MQYQLFTYIIITFLAFLLQLSYGGRLVTSSTLNRVVTEGATVTFSCKSAKLELQSACRWLRANPQSNIVERINHDRTVRTSLTPRYLVFHQNETGITTLVIRDVQLADAGTVTCAELFTSNYSIHFQLVVLAAEPICSVEPVNSTLTPTAAAFEIRCGVNYRGNILPTIQCYCPQLLPELSVLVDEDSYESLSLVERVSVTSEFHDVTCVTSFTTSDGFVIYSHSWSFVRGAFSTVSGESSTVTVTSASFVDLMPSAQQTWQHVEDLASDDQYSLSHVFIAVVFCVTVVIIIVVIAAALVARVVTRKHNSSSREIRNSGQTLRQRPQPVDLTASSSQYANFKVYRTTPQYMQRLSGTVINNRDVMTSGDVISSRSTHEVSDESYWTIPLDGTSDNDSDAAASPGFHDRNSYSVLDGSYDNVYEKSYVEAVYRTPPVYDALFAVNTA